MGENPGPSRKGIAQIIFKDNCFKKSLEREFIPTHEQATPRIIASVRELINNILHQDKILEILRNLYPKKNDYEDSFVGSQMGYIYDGKKECEDLIKEYLREQIDHKLISNLLPSKFTLSQLQNLYEILLDEKLDKRNFRKNISKIDVIKKTNEKQEGVAHKPAFLYTDDKVFKES